MYVIFVLQVIDGIIGSVESAFVTKLDYASKFELCVNNVLDFLIELKSSIPKVTSPENNIFGTNLSFLFVLVADFVFFFVGMMYPPNVVCC
jgi:hypothetical protein